MKNYANEKIEFEGCPGCAYAKHEFSLPCGMAYENEKFTMSQDWELPIPGFMVLSPKKCVEKLADLTKEEQKEMAYIIDKTIKILRENNICDKFNVIFEEKENRHFHIWIMPRLEWMNDLTDNITQNIGVIFEYAKKNMRTEENFNKIDYITKILKENFNKVKVKEFNLNECDETLIVELVKSKKIGPADLTDAGICPTCFDKKHNNILYGNNKDKIIYEDEDIECFLVGNPRANGHMAISTKKHYKDMMEIDEEICNKVFEFARITMKLIKEVYSSESVYLCTMCDGPMNHFHVQLIPRYSNELRGSKNFVKKRNEYIEDKDKIEVMRKRLIK